MAARKPVEADEGDKIRRLAEIAKRPPRAVLESVGALLVAASQRAFREGGLEGDPRWPATMSPNVPAIIGRFNRGLAPQPRHLGAGSQPLVDTGRLRQSINFRVSGPAEVEVGSNLLYSGAHQRGEASEITLSEGGRKQLSKYYRGLSRGKRKDFGSEVGFLFSSAGKSIVINVRKRPFLGVTRSVVDAIPSLLAEAI